MDPLNITTTFTLGVLERSEEHAPQVLRPRTRAPTATGRAAPTIAGVIVPRKKMRGQVGFQSYS